MKLSALLPGFVLFPFSAQANPACVVCTVAVGASLEIARRLGINESMIHEDFMIGSEDMDIDAVCENGDVVPVFRHGNWAF